MPGPVTTRPAQVAVTIDNPYNPSVIIGGDTALSDDSDSTFAQVYLTQIGGDPVLDSRGDVIVASFPSVTNIGIPLASADVRVRLTYEAEGSAAVYAYTVEAWRRVDEVDTEFIGYFKKIIDVSAAGGLSTVPAPDTLYDLTGYTFFKPATSDEDALATLMDALAREELAIRLGANEEVTTADAIHSIRVYELALTITYRAAIAAARRKTQRNDRLGIGNGRIHPPPSSQQYSNRRAGGYL